MMSPKIIRISIIKSISRDTKIKLENKLKSINKKKTKAIFLDVTSNHGSLNQAFEISNMLKLFKKENKNIPIYSFAEDSVLGPSIVVLTSCDKVFADKNTLFGCYDFIKKGNEYKHFLQDKKININFHTAGEHKFRLNPFEDLKEKDVSWINNLLSGLKNILIESVYENRKHLIKNKESFSKMFNSTIYFAEEAMDNKLIDDIGSINSVAFKEFPNTEMKKAKTKINLKQIIEYYKSNTFSICI
jgi:ClpP class serine protease